MKLRILDDSLRLRLAQGEVAELRDREVVTAAIHFPGENILFYRVRAGEVASLEAHFTEGTITLVVPRSALFAWADGEAVSLLGEQSLPGGRTLRLLLEKDFKCLAERPHEDESDLYPHPKEGGMKC